MALATVGTSTHLYRATYVKDFGLPGEVFVISASTMIAALPPGPLRALLEASYADDAAAQAALRDNPQIDLRIAALNTSTTDPVVNVSQSGGVPQIDGALAGAQNIAAVLVTLEYRHTLVR